MADCGFAICMVYTKCMPKSRTAVTVWSTSWLDKTECFADDPGKPTKGEMAKSIRLLIGNARDDEQLFDDLGRHWYTHTHYCTLLVSHCSKRSVLAAIHISACRCLSACIAAEVHVSVC